MAIQEVSGAPDRRKIGFVEEDPPSEAVEQLKGYDLYRFEVSHLGDPGTLATTAAVIFRQQEHKPTLIRAKLEIYAETLLAHDCRIFIQPALVEPGRAAPTFRKMVVNAIGELRLPVSGLSDAEAVEFASWRDGDGASLTPFVHILERPGMWGDVTAHLQRYPVDAPPQYELDIKAFDANGDSMELATEHVVLVRRAFSDCSSVQLRALPNGLSKVQAFRAYVHLRSDEVGSRWPYTYFVKIGKRSAVAREYSAYRKKALDNVPYHLGPRLRLERCALACREGIIVSDYVSGAETLKECARHGRAVPVIANLYNTTLWAWRNGSIPEDRPLQDYLSARFPVLIPAHRQPLVGRYGASKSLAELATAAAGIAATSSPVQVGVIHGDLHATNVLVRGSDAIIIDFEKVESRAPLLRDMASLEGGLFVDGFIGDLRSPAQLLDSVACLFEPESLLNASVVPCHPSDGSTWFFDCVRQIRMQAKQLELVQGQYATVLAVELARKGCNSEDFRQEGTRSPGLTREDVRALAYVLAERILTKLPEAMKAGGG